MRFLTLLLAVSLLPLQAQASVPVVAVFDIENEAQLESSDIKQLTNYLEAELTASRKYSVVPTAELRKALQEKKAESLDACYDESCQIEIGKEVAAEKTLATSISKIGASCLVTMQLYDLKRGASEAAATQRGECSIDSIFASLEKAVAELTGKKKSRLSNNAPRMQADETFGDQPSSWDIGGSQNLTIVYFRSKPEGAVVLLDGRLLCQKTPCSKSVPVGRHQVSMQLENYLPSVKEIEVSRTQRNEFAWTLAPNFGLVEVTSEPTRKNVKINGKDSGRTPLRKLMLPPGRHTVTIDDPCYFRLGQKFSLSAGQTKNIRLKLIPREGAVDVRTQDTEGNALASKVYANGNLLGTSPGTFKVPICTTQLELRAQDYSKKRLRIQVKEKQITSIKAQLIPDSGAKRARYLKEKKQKEAAKKRAQRKARDRKAAEDRRKARDKRARTQAARKRAAARRQALADDVFANFSLQVIMGTSFCDSTDDVCDASGPYYPAESPFDFGGLVYIRVPPAEEDPDFQISVGWGILASFGNEEPDPIVDMPLTLSFRFLSDEGYFFEPEIGYVFRSLYMLESADLGTGSNRRPVEEEGFCFSSGASLNVSEGIELGFGAYYLLCDDPIPSSVMIRALMGVNFDL